MLVHSNPLASVAAENDGLALAHAGGALLGRDLSHDGVSEDRRVTKNLHSLVTGLARTNAKTVLLFPFGPLRLILGSAVQALWRRMKDKRGFGCKEGKYAFGSCRPNAATIAAAAAETSPDARDATARGAVGVGDMAGTPVWD